MIKNAKFLKTLKIDDKQTYIIIDYKFWCNNVSEIEKWLTENTEQGTDTQEGMTISFCNEQEELMFMLRWY